MGIPGGIWVEIKMTKMQAIFGQIQSNCIDSLLLVASPGHMVLFPLSSTSFSSIFHYLLCLLVCLSSFPSSSFLKPPALRFPSTAQSQALAFIWPVKMGRRFVWNPLSPSWGSRINIRIQTAPGQPTTFPPYVQLKGSFLSTKSWAQSSQLCKWKI